MNISFLQERLSNALESARSVKKQREQIAQTIGKQFSTETTIMHVDRSVITGQIFDGLNISIEVGGPVEALGFDGIETIECYVARSRLYNKNVSFEGEDVFIPIVTSADLRKKASDAIGSILNSFDLREVAAYIADEE